DQMRSQALKIIDHQVNEPTEANTKYEIKYLLQDSKKPFQAEVSLYDVDFQHMLSLQGTTELSPIWNTLSLEESSVDRSNGGAYIFLFSAIDDHRELDKAHRRKPALEVNTKEHAHKWKEEHNMTPPAISLDREYIRAIDENKIVRITITKKEDEDKCVITDPACSFPNGIAKNKMVITNGSDGGAGGQFGELDGEGKFVAWSSWRRTELNNDYTYIYYKCPDEPKVISLTFTFDDIAEANDPAKPERQNKIRTFDDNPITSDPVKLTVWDFTITEYKAYRSSQEIGSDKWLPELGDTLGLQVEIAPKEDHKGTSLASMIYCVLGSSSEPEACKNTKLESLGYSPSWEYYWDLQFPYQGDFQIYSSNVEEGQEGPDKPPKWNYAISKRKVTKASLFIKCYDYGAYGALVVWADIPNVGRSEGTPQIWPPQVWPAEIPPPQEWPNGIWPSYIPAPPKGANGIWAHIKDKPDRFYLNIPIDDDHNYISDAWEFNKKGKQARRETEDEDDDPPCRDEQGNKKNLGDGLTAYDEYRGFFVDSGTGGKHTRTSPEKKDLFIFDDDDFRGKQWLIGYFAQLGLSLHYWTIPAERIGTKVTIYDRTAHLQNQYGVQTKIDNTPPSQLWFRDEQGNFHFIVGNTNRPLNNPGVTVKIFIKAIRCLTPPHIWLPDQGDTSAWDIEDPTDNVVATSVVAHEFGHSVNLHNLPAGIVHCASSNCIMFWEVNAISPQSSFCGICRNNIKLH
ncbi:MAG: hypothetical protein ACP5KZ_09045, partial [bacterium]